MFLVFLRVLHAEKSELACPAGLGHGWGMDTIFLQNFASGSSGNCTYIATANTRILIDAGISTKRIRGHLAEHQIDLEHLDGILVTHEHTDHIAGLPVLQRKHPVPLFANSGTVQSVANSAKHRDLKWNVFTNGYTFEVGDLLIEPYSIPHDAYDPVGYLIHWRGVKIGFATDIGLPTSLIRSRLKGCHAIVLETNHDELMLQNSLRPWPLKQRIMGRQGHLSNQAAAEMLVEVAGPELQRVYLAHLSEDCNRPELAVGTTRKILKAAGLERIELKLTQPREASEAWECTAQDSL